MAEFPFKAWRNHGLHIIQSEIFSQSARLLMQSHEHPRRIIRRVIAIDEKECLSGQSERHGHLWTLPSILCNRFQHKKRTRKVRKLVLEALLAVHSFDFG